LEVDFIAAAQVATDENHGLLAGTRKRRPFDIVNYDDLTPSFNDIGVTITGLEPILTV